MYAVVKTGGKQHKVVVGETLSVELLDSDAGAVVTLPALLVNDGENIITGEDAANATVTAEILGHGKADKVIVFKFKKRKGYKRTRGHRQNLTLVKVTDIALAGAPKAPKAKAAEVAVVEVAEAKPAVKKPVTKKPAVKKVAAASAEAKPAVKKPAAKKPAAKKPAAKKPAVKKTNKPAESAE